MRLSAPAMLCTSLCFMSMPALALDEIYSPNTEQGETSIEYAGSRTFDNHSDKNNAQEHEVAIERGVNDFWTASAALGYAKQPEGDVQIDHYELQSRFQFTPQGKYWADSGLLVAFDKAAHQADASSLEVKLLLAKDLGRLTNRANIGFAQSVGPNASGGPDYVFLWSTRYRYSEQVQPGFEIQSDLGADHVVRHFSQQEHYIGPALYGRLFGNLGYQTAYLVGVSDSASRSAARAQLEYEIHF